MADKTTTIRLTDDDQECVASLSKRTGIRSTTDVLCYSVRVALGAQALAPTGGDAPAQAGAEQFTDAIAKCREALSLWTPGDFEGARAKARAEEACARALSGSRV